MEFYSRIVWNFRVSFIFEEKETTVEGLLSAEILVSVE